MLSIYTCDLICFCWSFEISIKRPAASPMQFMFKCDGLQDWGPEEGEVWCWWGGLKERGKLVFVTEVNHRLTCVPKTSEQQKIESRRQICSFACGHKHMRHVWVSLNAPLHPTSALVVTDRSSRGEGLEVQQAAISVLSLCPTYNTAAFLSGSPVSPKSCEAALCPRLTCLHSLLHWERMWLGRS